MSIRPTVVLTALLGCGATAPKTYHAPDPSADNCSELFYMSGSLQRHAFVKAAKFEKEVERKCFLDVEENVGREQRYCTISVHRSTEAAEKYFAAASRDDAPTPGGDRLVHRGEITVSCSTSAATPPPEFAEVDKEVDSYMMAFAPNAKVADAYAGAKSPTQTATSTPAGQAHLALGPMTFKDTAGNFHLTLAADGTIVSVKDGNAVGGKLTPEGALVSAQDNESKRRLSPDGTFWAFEQFEDMKGMTFKVTADGAFTDGKRTIAFNDKGQLDPENGPGWTVEGATSPALKRTAMFFIIALMWPQHPFYVND